MDGILSINFSVFCVIQYNRNEWNPTCAACERMLQHRSRWLIIHAQWQYNSNLRDTEVHKSIIAIETTLTFRLIYFLFKDLLVNLLKYSGAWWKAFDNLVWLCVVPVIQHTDQRANFMWLWLKPKFEVI